MELIYDGAGNLVFDGVFFYQYDGFNRLIEIRDVGLLTTDDFDPNNAPHVLDPNFCIDPEDPNTFEWYKVYNPLFFTDPLDPNTYNGKPLYNPKYFADHLDPTSWNWSSPAIYDPNCFLNGPTAGSPWFPDPNDPNTINAILYRPHPADPNLLLSWMAWDPNHPYCDLDPVNNPAPSYQEVWTYDLRDPNTFILLRDPNDPNYPINFDPNWLRPFDPNWLSDPNWGDDPNHAALIWDPTDPNYRSLVWLPTAPNYPYDLNDPNTLPGYPKPMPQGAITRPGAAPGTLIAKFTYDALGRLVRKEGPHGDQGRYEEYVYDGARRIQTLFLDPSHCAITCNIHNYVYGPGYVDEFVCRIGHSDPNATPRDPVYFLQDDNYNVVGLVNSLGEVVRQYVYSPYGVPLINETFGHNPPSSGPGHQGLFFYPVPNDPFSDSLTANTHGL